MLSRYSEWVEEALKHFWDGRVQNKESRIVSQFGESAPSPDPLVVAVHLPVADKGDVSRRRLYYSTKRKQSTALTSFIKLF